MSQPTYKVPKKMQTHFDNIVALTDPFCTEYLNDEYAELARQMTAALARKRPSSLGRGRAKSWACGIVYALGQANFLFDRSQDPHLPAEELCRLFGVAKSTGGNKAKDIRDALKIDIFDSTWSLPSRLDRHPTAWLITVNGLIVDARRMPLEVQQIAFEKGLIPYIPDEG